MRFWRFTLLLLLLSPLAFGQKQYTEGTCILLQQQIERFSPQPQSRNYLDSKREFANHCQDPIPAPDKPLVLTNIPAKPAGQEVRTIVVPARKATDVSPPQPATAKTAAAPLKPADFLIQLFGATLQVLWLMLKALSIPLMIVFGLLLAFAVLGLIVRANGSRIKGALAERQLRRVLQRELPAGYQHYANLVLPTAQGDFTEIDHLVLSPYGIFVIEVKNYKGWIFGGEKQPQWTVQNFRSKHSFQNPLHQNYKHTEAVKHLLVLNPASSNEQVHSVVAFSLRADFKTRMPANVIFIELIGDYLQQYTHRHFNEEQLRQFSARLNMAADSKKVLSKLHMQQFDA